MKVPISGKGQALSNWNKLTFFWCGYYSFCWGRGEYNQEIYIINFIYVTEVKKKPPNLKTELLNTILICNCEKLTKRFTCYYGKGTKYLREKERCRLLVKICKVTKEKWKYKAVFTSTRLHRNFRKMCVKL